MKRFVLILIALLATLGLGYSPKNVVAQESVSALYIPLIGITSVPDPLALPNGAGEVTYHYAVKNFLQDNPLVNVQVVDDKCSSVEFITGDDNSDLKLDYAETWRYTCTTELSTTTQSTATATGSVGNINATHNAYATVIVGSNNIPPLVSIINITKIANPLSLPSGGGDITFTYKVTNPGIVPLSDVAVIDDQCPIISGKLGDTNGNDLLDVGEVWIYTCTTRLTQTTTNTARVTAFANGLQAVGETTITVNVQTPLGFPETGGIPVLYIRGWGFLLSVLAVLIIFYVLTRKTRFAKK